MINLVIGVFIAIIIIGIGIVVGVVQNRKKEETEKYGQKSAYVPKHLKSQEPPQDESAMDSALNLVNTKESPVVETPTTEEEVPPMSIQDVINAARGAASASAPADITMLEDIVVEDNPALHRIRTTKIKLLIKILKEKLIKMSPKIFKDLITYDPNGFTFCRWKIEEKDGLYTDTNSLERYTLLDMIRQRIPFASIDFIVYGKESILTDDKGNVNMDPAWWNFTHCFLIHPASFNISAVMDEIFADKGFSFLISSDCLMTVLDDVVNTVNNTNVFQSTLEFRASELKNSQEKSAARVLNSRFQDFLHPERLAEKQVEMEAPKGTSVIQEVISVETDEEPVTIEGDIRHA